MSELKRREYEEIKGDLDINLKDVLSFQINERRLQRLSVISTLLQVEVLLDIRESLASIAQDITMIEQHGLRSK